MPINSKHPDYEDYSKLAEFTELFMKGETAVKSAGEKLLPRLSGQDNSSYNAFKDRAIVFGVVQRTVQALVATAFRKDPVFVLSEQMEYMRDDCTGTGVSLQSFAMRLLMHLLVTGRAGVLVDLPKDGGKPRLVLYGGEELTNYDSNSDEPYVVLKHVIYKSDKDDKFIKSIEDGYLELLLDDGEYSVKFYELAKDKKGKVDYKVVDSVNPKRFGRPIDFIPFAPVSSFGLEYEVSTPPMLALAQLAHKAYVISADKFLALHVLAIPTPVICSSISKDELGQLELGPDSAIILPEGSTASFLEFKGQGLASLERAEEFLQNQMAALGAKMILGNTSNTTEKAAGVYAREHTSNSILLSVLTSMESALNKAIKWCAYFYDVNVEDNYCKISKELLTTQLDANMVNALVKSYLDNAIDINTLFHNLNEGGFIPPDISKDLFIKNLSEEKINKNGDKTLDRDLKL